jgi:hypothetical protein
VLAELRLEGGVLQKKADDAAHGAAPIPSGKSWQKCCRILAQRRSPFKR